MEEKINQIISESIINDIEDHFAKIITIKKDHIALTNDVFFIETEKHSLVLKLFSKNNQCVLPLDVHHFLIKQFSRLKITAECYYFNDDYFVLEYIDGTNLQLNNIDTLIIKHMSNIVKIMHDSKLILPKRELKDTAHTYIKYIKQSQLNNFTLKNTLEYGEKIFKQISYLKEDLCLCHNDLNINNFIVTKDRKLFLIDFEYASINDRYFDFAQIYNILGSTNFNIFIDAYKYPIDYKKLKLYNMLQDYYSIVWFFMMDSINSHKNINYIALSSPIYASLQKKWDCFDNGG